MLINLNELVNRALVVKGDVVVGNVDRVEVTGESIFIILEDDVETPEGEEMNIELPERMLFAFGSKP